MPRAEHTYDHIVDRLRSIDDGVMLPPRTPPLPPTGGDGTSVPMNGEPQTGWEPRVSRLELGFCAAFVMIFSAIIVSYLLLSSARSTTDASLADLRGNVQVLAERTSAMDKRLERVEGKIDTILERLPAPKR